MRLIDADALIAEWCEGCSYLDDGFCDEAICGGVILMKESPTIDAVPVVRCKDCIVSYCHSDGDFVCGRGGVNVDPDDFCSYGERRSEC